jgi:hypothetical protein
MGVEAGTESLQTPRWRKVDSNPQSRCCERTLLRIPTRDVRFQVRHRDDSLAGFPRPFGSRWDREFESAFLQQGVCCEPAFRMRNAPDRGSEGGGLARRGAAGMIEIVAGALAPRHRCQMPASVYAEGAAEARQALRYQSRSHRSPTC